MPDHIRFLNGLHVSIECVDKNIGVAKDQYLQLRAGSGSYLIYIPGIVFPYSEQFSGVNALVPLKQANQ